MSDKRLRGSNDTWCGRLACQTSQPGRPHHVRPLRLQRSIGSGPTHQSCPFCQPGTGPYNERKMLSDNSLRRRSMHAPPAANCRGGAWETRSVARSRLNPLRSLLPAPHDALRPPNWQSRQGRPAGSVSREKSRRTPKRGDERRSRPAIALSVLFCGSTASPRRGSGPSKV